MRLKYFRGGLVIGGLIPNKIIILINKKLGFVMRNYISIIALIVTFASMSIYAASPNQPSTEDEIKTVVSTFMNGIDDKDISAIEGVVLPEAKIVDVNAIANVMTSYNADDLYGKIRNRRLGGWKRDFEVVSIDTDIDVAFAKVKVNSSKITQYQYFTLVKEEGTWKIASCCTSVKKN